MNLTERIKIIAENYNIELSSFEALTASMILAFGECSADINVIEVGMGGQFDATNVFDFNPPICTIFTPIHIDHSLYLGNTIEEIAYNKSFLIKNDNKGNINNNIIISSQPKQALEILLAVCKKNNIPDENIYIYDRDFFISKIKNKNDIESKEFMLFESKKFGNFILNKPLLLGDYQMINATSAIMSVLASNLCDILPNAIMQNEMINNTINENIEYNEIISQGIINTKHIVRMEKIDKKEILNFFPIGSIFYIDGAHNQLAAFAMKQFIIDFKQNNESYKVYLAIARTKGANNENFVLVLLNIDLLNQNHKKHIIEMIFQHIIFL